MSARPNPLMPTTITANSSSTWDGSLAAGSISSIPQSQKMSLEKKPTLIERKPSANKQKMDSSAILFNPTSQSQSRMSLPLFARESQLTHGTVEATGQRTTSTNGSIFKNLPEFSVFSTKKRERLCIWSEHPRGICFIMQRGRS